MISATDLQSAVASWVEDHAEDLLKLAEALIRFPSENHAPKGLEKDC
jgi:hypothetical protein